jgi:hypothetical protein
MAFQVPTLLSSLEMKVQPDIEQSMKDFKAEKIQMFQPKEGKDLVLHQLAVVE